MRRTSNKMIARDAHLVVSNHDGCLAKQDSGRPPSRGDHARVGRRDLRPNREPGNGRNVMHEVHVMGCVRPGPRRFIS